MKNFYTKILSALLMIFIVAILIFDNFIGIYPTKTITEYYKELDNQEKVLAGESVGEGQILDLEKCGENLKCFQKYYENYNASTTLEKTLSNLTFLIKEKPIFADYCHFMMHGIGHAELEKQEGSVTKALNIFIDGKIYKNMSTCGSGYIHGVLEQGAKSIKNKEELVDYFNKLCTSKEIEGSGENDCYHGLGHASFIQLEYQTKDALYVCKKVAKNVQDTFNCYTGVFMEAIISLSHTETILKTEKSFEFPMCDNLSDELERRACFFESVIQFRYFVSSKPKPSFADMTPLCKVFQNDYYRMLCIRNVSIRSITENREVDLQKMCIQNTANKTERVFCVLGFAHRLAASLDFSKGAKYTEIYTDVCKVLNRDEALLCISIIKQTPSKTYYLEPKDMNI